MEIRVPEMGESVVEALVAKWHRKNGEPVTKEEPVCELETDKVTLEINAETDGILSILVREGETVGIGTIIGTIRETDASVKIRPPLSPSARKMMRQLELQPEAVAGSGKKGRVLPEDLMKAQEAVSPPVPSPPSVRPAAPEKPETAPAPPAEMEEQPYPPVPSERPVTRTPMTPIRKRIAERLTDARQRTAMVTTFNEVDMGRVIALRRQVQEGFRKRHGVSLGHMPFFIRACVEALREIPEVNARIDGDDIVYQHFYDISIAVSGEKGLVTPVLRDADRLNFADTERSIEGFVEKIRTNTLSVADLEGGTFTISNGGVFGSLLGTPLINPPQSAVLGMHLIQERPVALMGKVVIRPMMYVALSYDHRIIDGREGVRFLGKVKEWLEEPDEKLLED